MMSEIWDSASGTSAEPSTSIPFGRMVRYGEAPETILSLSGHEETALAGVLAWRKRTPEAPPDLEPKQTALVARGGVVDVYSEERVGPGDPVRIRHTGDGVGAFRRTADPGNTFLVTCGAKWRSKTSAAGWALLEIGMSALAVVPDEVEE